jgi:hypothetical protein
MDPDSRRRLSKVYAIVHELAMHPEVPIDHPLVSAAVELRYLTSYFARTPEEDRQ